MNYLRSSKFLSFALDYNRRSFNWSRRIFWANLCLYIQLLWSQEPECVLGLSWEECLSQANVIQIFIRLCNLEKKIQMAGCSTETYFLNTFSHKKVRSLNRQTVWLLISSYNFQLKFKFYFSCWRNDGVCQLGPQKQVHLLSEILPLTEILRMLWKKSCILYIHQFLFHSANQDPISLTVISKPKHTKGKC